LTKIYIKLIKPTSSNGLTVAKAEEGSERASQGSEKGSKAASNGVYGTAKGARR
jgi:hypothetical protein